MQRFALVASRFNQEIVDRLVEGAKNRFARHQILQEQLEFFWVPGAFELPLMAKKVANTGRFVAVICLGAIIRGESAHFEYVASCCSKGILEVSLITEIPIIFSVVTAYNMEQALARSLVRGRNEGAHGASAAIEMVRQLEEVETLCDLKR